MPAKIYRRRRGAAIAIIGLGLAMALAWQANLAEIPSVAESEAVPSGQTVQTEQPLARDSLEKLEIKGRAPKTGYSREQFGNGWTKWAKCDTRQKILIRDLENVQLDDDNCTVLSGVLNDPYTGQTIQFRRGTSTSGAIQIDHVVALSDAWQKGAQNLSALEREALANDDLELIAVDGPANMQKSDGDAATWLPPNKNFRCQYIARQIAVKIKYRLWVTEAEFDVMARILRGCPDERLPAP